MGPTRRLALRGSVEDLKRLAEDPERLKAICRSPWGFWRRGRWWYWKDYEDEFGFGMRCE
jgi:hypothetical protein